MNSAHLSKIKFLILHIQNKYLNNSQINLIILYAFI